MSTVSPLGWDREGHHAEGVNKAASVLRSRDRMVGCAGSCQQQAQVRGFWVLKGSGINHFTGPVQRPGPESVQSDTTELQRPGPLQKHGGCSQADHSDALKTVENVFYPEGLQVSKEVQKLQSGSRSALIGQLLGTTGCR